MSRGTRSEASNSATENIVESLIEALRNLQPISNQRSNNRFDRFLKEEETFDKYLQRFEIFFDINGIPENQKCLTLLNSIGSIYYSLVADLTAPALPKTKTYDEIVTLLRSQLSPEVNEISEQHKFSSTSQQHGESITEFIACLKKIATTCNFTCDNCQSNTSNKHLRSQFVCGLMDNTIREKLLLERGSFEEITKIALAIESSKAASLFIQNKYDNTVHSQEIYNQKHFKSNEIICYKCGRKNHKSTVCKAINLKCTYCKKDGHVMSVCRKRRSNGNPTEKLNIMEELTANTEEENIDDMMEFIHKCNIVTGSGGKLFICLNVNESNIQFEFDTGAGISTINEHIFKKTFPSKTISPSAVRIKSYSGDIISVLGEAMFKIKCEDKLIHTKLYIVPGNLDSICGRDLITKFNLLEINPINNMIKDDHYKDVKMKKILDDFSDVFENKIGTIPNYKASFTLRDNIKPKYFKPRPVPFAVRHLIQEEIERCEADGIFEKIENCDWGTPVVPIMKSQNEIRLCADYKVTLNQSIINDKYPIPRIEDLYKRLQGAKYFCVLDIHKAYLHMEMDDESALLQTISTHLGLYKVKKLMFGVKTAPNIWQRFMDTKIICGLDKTACFFDDIIIGGTTIEETDELLRIILQRLRDSNLHCGLKKCKFFENTVNYLGHTINIDGLHKTKEKVEAIVKIPRPENIEELRRFLGMVNYYNNFIPNLASKLYCLNKLLQKNQEFVWSKECERAFDSIKKDLISDNVLTVYNENEPLILATDASPYGISAILSHVTPYGERPIAYASRTLSKSEQNYSHIDKEATAIFWGLHKFFNYCYGREFTIYTDNKPISLIFDNNKQLPIITAQRLLRYAQFLSGFNYSIKYRKASENINADFLSRQPVVSEQIAEKQSEIYAISDEILPITIDIIAKETEKDRELSDLLERLKSGRPLTNTSFEGKEHELMVQNGCIYKGMRVLIPVALQAYILKELHEAHIGIVKMKALARSYCYWRNIDKDIEDITLNCRGCALVSKNPSKVPVHSWEIPHRQWERIHLDFAGPFLGKYFLIVVDAKTKWIEVEIMSSTTSLLTIRAFRSMCARFGLPKLIVTDNGTNFSSLEFNQFLKRNNIRHKYSAPGHPASNGQAERFVQEVKRALKAAVDDHGDLYSKLDKFLMQSRKTVNSTGMSSSEQMLKFQLRTRLNLLCETMEISENVVPMHVERYFDVGDRVQFRNYVGKDKWKFGKIKAREGVLHYIIDCEGIEFRRHIDQCRRSNISNERAVN